MFRQLCKNIRELFPEAGGFPSVEQILTTPDDYDAGFYSNNPKQYAVRLIEDGFLPRIARDDWKSQVILDLGCGRQTLVYAVACLAGARAYVPVDKYHMPHWLEKFVGGGDWKNLLEHHEVASGTRLERIPVFPVYGDMCSLLEKLPDSSAGILLAGIDRCIIDEEETADNGRKRLEVLLTEIPRVLSPSSSCISFMSFLDLNSIHYEGASKNLRVFKK